MSDQENTPPETPIVWSTPQPPEPQQPPVPQMPAPQMPMPPMPPAPPVFTTGQQPTFQPLGPAQGMPYPPGQYGQPAGFQPGFQPGYQQAVPNPFDSRGTTILILGILGLLLCPFLGPVAWYMGNALRNDATRAQFPEPGVGKAGRILGIIGTVYAALVVGFIILMIIGIAAGSRY